MSAIWSAEYFCTCPLFWWSVVFVSCYAFSLFKLSSCLASVDFSSLRVTSFTQAIPTVIGNLFSSRATELSHTSTILYAPVACRMTLLLWISRWSWRLYSKMQWVAILSRKFRLLRKGSGGLSTDWSMSCLKRLGAAASCRLEPFFMVATLSSKFRYWLWCNVSAGTSVRIPVSQSSLARDGASCSTFTENGDMSIAQSVCEL